MKTKTPLFYLWPFIFCLFLSPVPCALSQIPQGFNYQAIARDGSGNILPNTPLQAMMYVQSLSTGGTIFWKELHSTITTNSFGLFTLVVGTGSRQIESTVATFNLIDWSVIPKYLKTEIYYSGSWKDLGTSQLMSVPYAMTAGDLAGTVDKLSVKGTTSGLEEALFEVKNKDGQTVFAVYNEGVRVYVSDGAKAVKGGFAVGGFGTDKAESTKYLFVGKDSVRIYLDTNPLTKKLKGGFAVGGYDITKGTVQDYLDVNSDSVRIYIDSNPATKKVKGGFAVGGYDMTKAPQEEYLRVTRDSTRIYVNENASKAVKGGFAVGGFDATKGIQATPFTSLTPENYFIGHEGGQKTTTGKYNSVVGFQSGKNLTTGSNNVFMGYQAGYLNAVGSSNVFLGNTAGYNNTANNNVFIGFESGYANTSGTKNSFMGYQAGKNNTNGSSNVFIGNQSGITNETGMRNVFLGNYAGYLNKDGHYNVIIGDFAGYNNNTGPNIMIGQNAGYSNTTGGFNVMLGYLAGRLNISGSSNIMIGNNAAENNQTGSRNLMIGPNAGRSINANDNIMIGSLAGFTSSNGTRNILVGNYAGENLNGNYNIIMGYMAGRDITSDSNTMIGDQAGLCTTTGESNTFVGKAAGYYNKTGSNNTALGTNASVASFLTNANALGYNAFVQASNTFVFGNSDVVGWGFGVDPGTAAIKVGSSTSNGNGATLTLSGVWTNASDVSKKYDIENINYGLHEVMKLRPVTYKLRGLDNHDIGFIAQEVKKIIPEIIYGEEGDMTMSYGQLTSVLVKAIQQQQQQIESYKSQLQTLLDKVDKIESLLAKALDE